MVELTLCVAAWAGAAHATVSPMTAMTQRTFLMIYSLFVGLRRGHLLVAKPPHPKLPPGFARYARSRELGSARCQAAGWSITLARFGAGSENKRGSLRPRSPGEQRSASRRSLA